MVAAGISQGLLWLSVNTLGELSFSFREVMAGMKPYYALRLVAGLIFWSGTLLMSYNLWRTIIGASVLRVAVPPVPAPWRIGKAAAQPASAGGQA